MNSGKVRIYELSKELNLDNKDLLAVCEQLNISVKSHSSTITDTEAELIRTAAEKYTANHPSPSKSAPSRQGHNVQMAEPKTKTSAPVQKKQQILEIRKPIIRQTPSLEPPNAPKPNAPQPAASELPSVPAKPSISSRPAHPAASSSPRVESVAPEEHPQPPRAIQATDVTSEDVTSELELTSEEPVLAVPSARTANDDDVVATVDAPPPPTSQPELSGPPARPSAPPSTPKPGNLSNRPLLKRARTEQPPSGVAGAVEASGRSTNAPEREQ